MKKLLLATGNRHKIEELTAILSGIPYELISTLQFPNISQPEEGSSSYLENASKKAVGFSLQTGMLAVADDSGLEIDFLNGAPGVLSSRFFGESSYSERCEKLLKMMADVPKEKRGAKFVCTAAIADGSRILASFEGELKGSIAYAQDGSGGFGYDPVFFVQEYKTVLACLDSDVKNKISHRAKAMAKVAEFLLRYK